MWPALSKEAVCAQSTLSRLRAALQVRLTSNAGSPLLTSTLYAARALGAWSVLSEALQTSVIVTFTIWLRRRIAAMTAAIEARLVEPEDYTVLVKGLPRVSTAAEGALCCVLAR